MPSAKSSTTRGKVGGKVKGEDTKSTSRSTKAGLQFPVSRIHRMLRRANISKRIGSGAPGKLPSSFFFFCGRIERNSLVIQYTSLPCWSTCRPRSSSWLETQLVTTRSAVSTLATFNSPSETMKSELPPFVYFVAILAYISPPRLSKLLGDVIISEGGVVPYINPAVRWILLAAQIFLFLNSLNSCSQRRAKSKASTAKKSNSLYHYSHVLHRVLSLHIYIVDVYIIRSAYCSVLRHNAASRHFKSNQSRGIGRPDELDLCCYPWT